MAVDTIVISKIMDKVNFCKNRNSIESTEFLHETQINQIQNELNKIKFNNYLFEGGFQGAENKVLILYPENLDREQIIKAKSKILKAIKIELPSENYGKLEHKNYLGTVMSFGLARDRIGDIIVYDDCAYLIVLSENAEYIKNSFMYEKIFKKAKISIIEIEEVKTKPTEFEDIIVSVNSNRLDSIISEMLNISRKNAKELLDDDRVSINYQEETKYTRSVKKKDILIIRGKGKFVIEEFRGLNKKNKEIILIKKYK